jgi:hypothetical protein
MTKIQNLSAVDTNTIEGRYLMAALAKITTESQTDKTPDEVLEQCFSLQEYMYKDATPIPDDVVFERPPFGKALQDLINSYSMENGSNTPDFVLADYLKDVLHLFNQTVNRREEWYGRKAEIVLPEII